MVCGEQWLSSGTQQRSSDYCRHFTNNFRVQSKWTGSNGLVHHSILNQTGMRYLTPANQHVYLLELVMLKGLEDTEIDANIQGCRINNLRFVDDIVLIADNPKDLQTLVDKVFGASSDYGLKINIQETDVRESKSSTSISATNKWKTLSTWGTIATCGEDIKTRIRKAGAAFQRLITFGLQKNISN